MFYLDINCVYCYYFEGVVNILGLYLVYGMELGMEFGVYKVIVFVGVGIGGYLYFIVLGNFDEFILLY